MRVRAVELLVCPLDGKPLELSEWEAERRPLRPEGRERALKLGIDPATLECEILTGVLVNPRLHLIYPVITGVPHMLTFSTAIGAAFSKRHSDRLVREFPGFSLPSEAPMPGEAAVLRSFSAEWVNYGWNEKAYWGLHPDHLYDVMDFMLDFERRPLTGQRVLEVGTGVGGIANHIASTQECELFGIDLSHAVEPAYTQFGSRNPFFHVIHASAFRPPFREQSFDLVFSQGVLHHTFSTRAAVEAVAPLPKVGGRLYVWIYSPHDECRTIARRMLYGLERIMRPICKRLPTVVQSIVLAPLVPLYIVHQSVVVQGRRAVYGWREAMHAARDRFTPPYAHRHSDGELCDWFRALGYGQLQVVSKRDRPNYVPLPFVACTGVDGVREGPSGQARILSMSERIAIFTPQNPTGVPSQGTFIQEMLARDGYEIIQVGAGKTGLRRLLDVVWRGPRAILRTDVVLVDVFGMRAFVHESLAILYAKLLRRRVVAMLRGGWLPNFLEAWPRVGCWVLTKPDLLLTPHAFLADELKKFDLEVDEIIPNIINLRAYHYRERAPLQPRFLYLRGMHEGIYNPSMCLRAFASIQARYPEASVTFAGVGSPALCKALSRQLKLRNISFVGLVPKNQIPELVDRHDIYFQSNRIENMPITVLEMWACGVAVAGTDVGGMPYLVQQEVDGLLVPSEDHGALAEACCRLLEDPQLALRLVRNGRARVEQLTWERVRDQWHDVLQLKEPVEHHQERAGVTGNGFTPG